MDEFLNDRINIDNLLDFCTNDFETGSIEENVALPKPSFVSTSSSLELTDGLQTPMACSTLVSSKTPPLLLQKTIVDVMNTPGSLPKRKRDVETLEEASEEDEHQDIKEKMTAGWLGSIVKNADVTIFGVLQILGFKEQPVGDRSLTLFKASDGKTVTWQVTSTPEVMEDLKALACFSVIEVTKATLHHGYRLIIQSFGVLDENVEKEVVVEDELEFLDKDYYEKVFANKGMLTKQGHRVENHPGFQLTPVRMTRSKTRQNQNQPKLKKLKTGGYECDDCHKKYKSEKWFNLHTCT